MTRFRNSSTRHGVTTLGLSYAGGGADNGGANNNGKTNVGFSSGTITARLRSRIGSRRNVRVRSLRPGTLKHHIKPSLIANLWTGRTYKQRFHAPLTARGAEDAS